MDGPTVLRVKRPRELHSSDVLVLDFHANGASSLADQLAAAAVLGGQQQQPPAASAPAAKRRRYVRVCAGVDSQVQDPQQLWALLQQLPSSNTSHPPSHTHLTPPTTPATTTTTTASSSSSHAFQSAAGVTVVDLQHSAADHWAVLRSRPPSRHQHQQQQQQEKQGQYGAGAAAAEDQAARVQLSAQEQEQLPQPLQELLLEVLEQQQQGQRQEKGAADDNSSPAKAAGAARPRRVVRRRPAAPPAAAAAAAAAAAVGVQQDTSLQQQHQQQQSSRGDTWQCELLPDAELLRSQMVLGDCCGRASSSGGGGGGVRGGGTSSQVVQQEEWLYDVYVAADDVSGPHATTTTRSSRDAAAAAGAGGAGSVPVEGLGAAAGELQEEEELAAVSIELWEEDTAQLDLLLAMTGAAPADAAARDDPAALDSEDSNAEGYYAASYPDDDTDPEERLSELLGGDECESSEGAAGEEAWWARSEAGTSSSRPNGMGAAGYDLRATFGVPGVGPGYPAAAAAAGGCAYGSGQGCYSSHPKRHRGGRGQGQMSSEEYDVEEYEEQQEAAWRRELLAQVQTQRQGQGSDAMDSD